MWRTEGYMLEQVGGESYLLPFGQLIADQRHGMKLNEAGVFLWNALPEAADKEELLMRFAEFCEASKEELPIVRKDLEDFLLMFSEWGMYREEGRDETKRTDVLIAGIHLRIYGEPELIPAEFSLFSEEAGDSADLELELIENSGTLPYVPRGEQLVWTDDLEVYEREDSFCLCFPRFHRIRYAMIEKTAKRAKVYLFQSGANKEKEKVREQLFHAIRPLFLYAAQKRGLFAIHSASILYRGRAWVFSAPSGTGKSTHTSLWNRLFSTPVLNGDLNLLTMEEGPRLCGLPWCGTSGIASRESYLLGGIVFLKQAPINEIHSLSKEESVLAIMQRFISPSWTKELAAYNLRFAKELEAEGIMVRRLFCTKEDEAAKVMKREVDSLPDFASGEPQKGIQSCWNH